VQTLSEVERSMLFQERLSSELSPDGGFEEVGSANGVCHFQEQSEKISSKDKEIKKKLSALKGRQLRLLARLSVLEIERFPTAGAVCSGQTEQRGSRYLGDSDVCSNTRAGKPSGRTKITSSAQSPETEARPSASNGTLVIFLLVRLCDSALYHI
jgi:hypothetical protein